MPYPKSGNGKTAGGDRKEFVEKEDIKVEFLREYASCGSVRKAATKVGAHQKTVMNWMAADEVFADKFDAIRDNIIGDLEIEADKRARTSSDSLLMFLLKAYDPQRYNPTVAVNASAGDGQAKVVLQISSSILNDEEVALIAKAADSSKDNQGPTELRTKPDAGQVP
jgi:hypothetical protein